MGSPLNMTIGTVLVTVFAAVVAASPDVKLRSRSCPYIEHQCAAFDQTNFRELGADQAAQAVFRARSQHADAMHRRLRGEAVKTEKHNKDCEEKALHLITHLQPTISNGGMARDTISHAKS
jgi:hypothetical protein